MWEHDSEVINMQVLLHKQGPKSWTWGRPSKEDLFWNLLRLWRELEASLGYSVDTGYPPQVTSEGALLSLALPTTLFVLSPSVPPSLSFFRFLLYYLSA